MYNLVFNILRSEHVEQFLIFYEVNMCDMRPKLVLLLMMPLPRSPYDSRTHV